MSILKRVQDLKFTLSSPRLLWCLVLTSNWSRYVLISSFCFLNVIIRSNGVRQFWRFNFFQSLSPSSNSKRASTCMSIAHVLTWMPLIKNGTHLPFLPHKEICNSRTTSVATSRSIKEAGQNAWKITLKKWTQGVCVCIEKNTARKDNLLDSNTIWSTWMLRSLLYYSWAMVGLWPLFYLISCLSRSEYPLKFTHRNDKGELVVGKQFGVDGKQIVRIDGPHASPSQHYDSYQRTMVVGAGIGMTPCASILRGIVLYRWKRDFFPECLNFYWTCRHSDVNSFQWCVFFLCEWDP